MTEDEWRERLRLALAAIGRLGPNEALVALMNARACQYALSRLHPDQYECPEGWPYR